VANHTNRIGAGVLAAAIACTFAAPAFAAPAGEFAPTNRFIVKFKSGSNEFRSADARKRVIDAAGAGQGLHLGKTRRLAVGADLVFTDRKLDPHAQQAFMRKLRNDPRVEYVIVDKRMHAMLNPNDTEYLKQWDLRDTTVGIRVPSAWDLATGTGVVVAVIDTGITDHPDLDGQILPGYDFISEDFDGGFFTANDGDGRDADAHDPGDWVLAGEGCSTSNSSWHGTHVAGTVAALTNNARGVAGVAFGAKVQPVRVLGKCGGYTSDIADAIIWASGGSVPGVPANPTPAEVINMSLGGGGACDPLTQQAVNIAVANGTTVVVAAGNDKADAAAFNPASCENVVTVAATDVAGGRAGYSNFGDVVDLAAPGGDGKASEQILSTLNSGTTTPNAPVDYYKAYAGTSMASPHVAGVAALMQSKAVNSPEVVQAILKGTARAFPSSCPGCGTGLLTAATAVSQTSATFLYVNDLSPIIEGDSGNKTATFHVKLSRPAATAVTFNIATADSTATAADGDYVANSATGVTIPAGQIEATFSVVVNGDTAIENNESFNVVVSNVVGVAALGTTGRLPILNDDANAIPLQNGDVLTGLTAPLHTNSLYQIDLPANAHNLTITTSNPDLTVDIDLYARYQLPASNEQWDYVSGGADSNEQIVIPDPTAGRYYISVYAFEAYSNLTLSVSYEGGVVLPGLSINDAGISEGDSGTKLLTFTATLSEASGSTVTFNAATTNGTATAGRDFVALAATGLTIPAGQLSRTFTVTINGDTTLEANENFFVNLTGATGASITDGEGVGTIVNDDTATPTLRISDANVTEGNSGTKLMSFTATLGSVSSSAVTFNASSQGNTATAGVDFASLPVTGFSIPAGQLSTTVNVTINGDTAVETNETFFVWLSSITGATLADGLGIGTITNDDTAATSSLRINDASISEGNSGTKVLTFTASLNAASANAVNFNASTQSNTAAAGVDFASLPLTAFSIPAGQLSKTFGVTINGDTTVENDETFFVWLSSVSGATLADGQGIGTIANDDSGVAPGLRIGDATVSEGNSGT
jgi:serine protease